MPRPRRFYLVLITPSRSDDAGHVVQWRRVVCRSNTLSALTPLAEECARRQVLGPEIAIEVEAHDDQCAPPAVERWAARARRAEAGCLVCLVGVHSAQCPRAAALARRVRAAGPPVVIGGFPVSGTMATLPEPPPERRAMLDLGVSLFVGEGEGRLEAPIRDAVAGTLRPIYACGGDLIDLAAAPPPAHLPPTVERRLALALDPIDPIEASCGCPYGCSVCPVITVHGRRAGGGSGLCRDGTHQFPLPGPCREAPQQRGALSGAVSGLEAAWGGDDGRLSPWRSPQDARQCARRYRNKQDPLAVGLLYPFVLTPLPGSADHAALWTQGGPLDPDLSRHTMCWPREAWAPFYARRLLTMLSSHSRGACAWRRLDRLAKEAAQTVGETRRRDPALIDPAAPDQPAAASPGRSSSFGPLSGFSA